MFVLLRKLARKLERDEKDGLKDIVLAMRIVAAVSVYRATPSRGFPAPQFLMNFEQDNSIKSFPQPLIKQ